MKQFDIDAAYAELSRVSVFGDSDEVAQALYPFDEYETAEAADHIKWMRDHQLALADHLRRALEEIKTLRKLMPGVQRV